MLEKIINLPKHNTLKVSAEIEVISVENGWIYEFWDTNDQGYMSHVFVPKNWTRKDSEDKLLDTRCFDDFIEVKDGIESLLVPGGSVYKLLYIVDSEAQWGDLTSWNRAGFVFVPHENK